MRLDMGSQVRTSDGKDAGKIKRIIFDGDTMTVRQFVAHEGIIFSEERMIDVEYIERVDDDHTVHLNISEDKVDDLTPFVHAEVMPLVTGDAWVTAEVHDVVRHPGSVPFDLLVLTHGTDVYDSNDKHIGNLDEVVYTDEGQASSFIVDAGRIFTHDVNVPVTAVKSMTHERIELNITAEAAEAANR